MSEQRIRVGDTVKVIDGRGWIPNGTIGLVIRSANAGADSLMVTSTMRTDAEWEQGVTVYVRPENLELVTLTEKTDTVNHPPHYKAGGVETIDFIEAKGLGYHLGNVVKYVSRAGVKDEAKHVEDLRKARWYLDREIERLSAEVV